MTNQRRRYGDSGVPITKSGSRDSTMRSLRLRNHAMMDAGSFMSSPRSSRHHDEGRLECLRSMAIAMWNSGATEAHPVAGQSPRRLEYKATLQRPAAHHSFARERFLI